MQRQTICLDHKEMALITKRDRCLSGPKSIMVLLKSPAGQNEKSLWPFSSSFLEIGLMGQQKQLGFLARKPRQTLNSIERDGEMWFWLWLVGIFFFYMSRHPQSQGTSGTWVRWHWFVMGRWNGKTVTKELLCLPQNCSSWYQSAPL